MGAVPAFLLRLNAETARLLQQQDRQGRPIRHWQMMVFYPSRDLNFGDHTPVREFVRERLVWIELAPERLPPTAPPLQRALAMLLLPEEQLPDCYSIGTPRHTPALANPPPTVRLFAPPPAAGLGIPC